MNRTIITTDRAPAAIGPYSQGVLVGKTAYLSGQIPLVPGGANLIDGPFPEHVRQVLKNLSAVAEAAGSSLAQAVKLTVYLTDLKNFAEVNRVMEEFFKPPYPARAAIGVKALPREAAVEIDAVLYLD